MDDAPYKPSAWGALFHSLTYDEVLGAGSAGPGKSWVLLMDPFQQVATEAKRIQLPKSHPLALAKGASIGWALHLRRTFPRVKQAIARSMRVFPRIDPGARWSADDKMWTFTSGYRYQFGHCDNSDSWVQYTGQEYTHLSFDELVEFEEEQYDQICMRVRTGDPVLVKMLKIRAASNPVMTQMQGHDTIKLMNPHWVRDRFVAPHPRGKKVLKRRVNNPDGSFRAWRTMFYLPATIEDNPDPVVREDYKTRLLSAKPHIRQALYYGDWFITAGSYYAEEWNPRIHVCDPFPIPGHWVLFRSMDWGFKMPGCIHWWAMDPDGSLFCVRELWFQGMLAGEVAEKVKEIESGPQLRCWGGDGSHLTGPADTQLWERRGDSGMTKAEEFSSLGVQWAKADKRDRTRNAELLTARLRDHGQGTATPGIVFFSHCANALRTIPQIQTDPSNPESPADGRDDHAHDSILYACAYASHGPVGQARDAWMDRRGALDDDEDDNERLEEKRGVWGYG